MQPRLLIFGLGHLASKIIEANCQKFLIYGTFRSPKPLNKLVNKSIQFELGDELFDISGYDRIVINFPPQEKLLSFLKELLPLLAKDQTCLFVSSTSVYGIGNINESSPLDGMPRSGSYLLDCEKYLSDKNCVIIRPGGLVDEGRDPINFFKKSKTIKGIQNHINYIHTFDLASFILRENFQADTYNLIAPLSYTKKDFYQAIIKDQKEWEFIKDETPDRLISSMRAEVKNFDFTYPDLLKYFTTLHHS